MFELANINPLLPQFVDKYLFPSSTCLILLELANNKIVSFHEKHSSAIDETLFEVSLVESVVKVFLTPDMTAVRVLIVIILEQCSSVSVW